MTTINQKEYLKKYLGIGKAPGQKKKKKKALGDRLKIIDDDMDVSMSQEIQQDIAADNEDAPQIVAVIDERPPSLRVDEQTQSNLWKPIGVNDSTNEEITLKLGSGFKLNKQGLHSTNSPHNSPQNVKSRSVSDSSHLQVVKTEIIRDDDISPPRVRRDDDYSPPRRNIKVKEEVPHERKNSADSSPPRRKNKVVQQQVRKMKITPHQEEKMEKMVTRLLEKETGIEIILPYIENKDRTICQQQIDLIRIAHLTEKSIEINHRQEKNENKEVSTSRKDNTVRTRLLTPRRRNREYTPPGRKDSRTSPKKHTDRSPTHKRSSKSRWGSPDIPPQKMDKLDKMRTTLDGKTAGLQNAQDLVKETALLKQKEDQIFQNMSAEVSGRNAATVVRAKKVPNPEEEALQLEKEKKTKEKYDRWGKGLKQVEDREEQVADQLHEMSKPLARYADDEDLEKYLKEQERDGDPMLDYIRKKKKKHAVAAGVPDSGSVPDIDGMEWTDQVVMKRDGLRCKTLRRLRKKKYLNGALKILDRALPLSYGDDVMDTRRDPTNQF
ncbi:hypothetical protein NQ318_012145 [Aromia moschata]|uniref:BUD13 homolog n=1 Tax=Aromia moschata TaxID=1265417 RepID=A0AAV8Z1N7_9CUCU|nr:hypothetical protein NQ318_012145 [Aromia moschata]